MWWIDRCLGTTSVPERLRALGADIRLYRETYPNDPAVEDARWILEITANGWCILTKDSAIRTNPAERAILLRARARYVTLASANLSGAEQADLLAHHWRTIEGVVAVRKPPLILSVNKKDVCELKESEWAKVKHKRG